MADLFFLTAVREPRGDAVPVNPGPNGERYLFRHPFPMEMYDDILKQYQGRDPLNGWVIQRSDFLSFGRYIKDPGAGDPEVSENYIDDDDFVLSPEGVLLGFTVGEGKVFWIRDFQPGGKYYEEKLGYHPDLILKKECDRGEYHVVYGYLTHSRW